MEFIVWLFAFSIGGAVVILIVVPILIVYLLWLSLPVLLSIGLGTAHLILDVHGTVVRWLMIPIRDWPLRAWRPSAIRSGEDFSVLRLDDLTTPQAWRVLEKAAQYRHRDQTELRILSVIWRFVVPPVLGLAWFLSSGVLMHVFFPTVWALLGGGTSAGIAVWSYYRIYFEYPLPHPTTFMVLEEESLMRLEQKTRAIEQKIGH